MRRSSRIRIAAKSGWSSTTKTLISFSHFAGAAGSPSGETGEQVLCQATRFAVPYATHRSLGVRGTRDTPPRAKEFPSPPGRGQGERATEHGQLNVARAQGGDATCPIGHRALAHDSQSWGRDPPRATQNPQTRNGCQIKAPGSSRSGAAWANDRTSS
jgi:hypothetical protein